MGETVDVTVGRVGRAHGIRGDIAIELRTDEPARRFRPGSRLQLVKAKREVEIAAVKWHRGKLLVSFVGYPDRTAVEALTGDLLEARVPAAELPSEPEEYFDRQLVGLAVLNAAGERVGVIDEVLHLPAQDVLSVAVDGQQRLVPFVKELVPKVELAAGQVQLADIEGLLEEAE